MKRFSIRILWFKSHWLWAGVALCLVASGFVLFRQGESIKRAERGLITSHITSCSECHAAQAELFHEVPHAQTLRRADLASEWGHFTKQPARIGAPIVEFRYREQGGRLLCKGERTSSEVAVDWIFGSGHHGQTAVSIRENDRGEVLVLEHHATWYATHGLDRTIGRPFDLGKDKNDVGELIDSETTRRCFGCHTTALPERDGRLDLDHLVSGVLCARCHLGADQHAKDMKSGHASATEFDNRRQLSPFQSVARCGECHRMPTSFSPKELSHQNASLPRFAPVGLLMSKCFQLQHTQPQITRMDCTTCHDPHRPTKTDPNHYNHTCLECHRGDATSLSHCPNQSLESNCVNCHMPKVSIDAPAKFTDHWIRVRDREP